MQLVMLVFLFSYHSLQYAMEGSSISHEIFESIKRYNLNRAQELLKKIDIADIEQAVDAQGQTLIIAAAVANRELSKLTSEDWRSQEAGVSKAEFVAAVAASKKMWHSKKSGFRHFFLEMAEKFGAISNGNDASYLIWNERYTRYLNKIDHSGKSLLQMIPSLQYKFRNLLLTTCRAWDSVLFRQHCIDGDSWPSTIDCKFECIMRPLCNNIPSDYYQKEALLNTSLALVAEKSGKKNTEHVNGLVKIISKAGGRVTLNKDCDALPHVDMRKLSIFAYRIIKTKIPHQGMHFTYPFPPVREIKERHIGWERFGRSLEKKFCWWFKRTQGMELLERIRSLERTFSTEDLIEGDTIKYFFGQKDESPRLLLDSKKFNNSRIRDAALAYLIQGKCRSTYHYENNFGSCKKVLDCGCIKNSTYIPELLEQGANVVQVNARGYTFLHWMAEHLPDQGKRDPHTCHWYSAWRDTKVDVLTLILHYAKNGLSPLDFWKFIHHKNKKGEIALDIANLECKKRILRKNHILAIKNFGSENLNWSGEFLVDACRWKEAPVVQQLLSMMPPDEPQRDIFLKKALFATVYNLCADKICQSVAAFQIVKALMNANVNLGVVDKYGKGIIGLFPDSHNCNNNLCFFSDIARYVYLQQHVMRDQATTVGDLIEAVVLLDEQLIDYCLQKLQENVKEHTYLIGLLITHGWLEKKIKKVDPANEITFLNSIKKIVGAGALVNSIAVSVAKNRGYTHIADYLKSVLREQRGY